MPTAELLARYMPVFVPELPGHGASSKPHRALSVEHQADILFRWFQLNKLQRANIFANSYGCQIVAQLAVDHPEIVDRLILTGPTGDPAAPTVWQRIYRLLLDGLFEPCGAKRQLFRDLCDMTFPIICGTVRCMMKNDIKPNLRAITCRTLVVRGGNDPIASQAWTEEVARTISGAQLIVMPEAPHCVNFANAEELTGILVQFLNEP
jgi:pimeloyl-ACP methyl ester carboxylesterase